MPAGWKIAPRREAWPLADALLARLRGEEDLGNEGNNALDGSSQETDGER